MQKCVYKKASTLNLDHACISSQKVNVLLRRAIRLRHIKCCSLFLVKGGFAFEHKHSAVLSLPEMQCHAAVPPGPGSHGKGVWKGLSSIFSHWQCPNTQTLKILHIYTNKWTCICKHKHANRQTCTEICVYLHISTLIGIVRSVLSDKWSPHDSFHTSPGTIWAYSVFLSQDIERPERHKGYTESLCEQQWN